MNKNFKFWRGFLFSRSFRRVILCTSDRFCRLAPWAFKKLTFEENTHRYKKLHLILRANDSVMNLNAHRDLESIGLKTKFDVLKMGITSLAMAAKKFAHEFGAENISVTIINDNLSDAGKRLAEQVFTPLPVEFVQSDCGNGPTFRTQILHALSDPKDTLVAICEDDYLFYDTAFTTAFNLFNSVKALIGFTPHNHPNTIRLCLPTQIYKLEQKFYQLTHLTTCTFMTGADTIQKYKRKFLRYNGREENSINSVWKHNICISPCAWTLAEHLHHTELSPVQKLVP